MSQPHQAIELLSNLSGEILAVSAGDAAGLESIRRTLQDAAEALGQQNSHLSDLLGSAGRIIQRALEDKQALSESQRMLAAKAIDLVCQQADPTCKARPRQVDLLGSQLVASLDEAKRPGCLEAPAFGDFDKSEPRKQAPGPEPVQREDCPPSGAEEADDTSLLREYVDASLEHLAKAENCLLKLESNPHQENYIHQALRAFHTLKGSSAMMGFTPIEHMSHLAENLLSQARSGQIEIRESRTDIALQACDVLRSLVQQTTTLQRQQRLECPHGYDLLAGQLSLA
ncbi:MAG: Hpt domain-containing protein, partial [Planctomycetota bacterium]